MRKATRAEDIEKVTIIIEGIAPPPDPETTKEWPPKTFKPSTGQKQLTLLKTKTPPPEARRCLLASNNGYHMVNGRPVIFASRAAAKRVRNQLNSKLGCGYYWVECCDPPDAPLKAAVEVEETDVSEMTEEERYQLAMLGYIPGAGYWGGND